MLVISNRSLNKEFEQTGKGGAKAFGEQVNAKGPNEIRLANANKVGGKWVVDLVKEPKNMTEKTLPSYVQFKKVLSRCVKAKKNGLFYIHGYNKTFKESIDQGLKLQKKYNLQVVVFSWPSNTGGFVRKEYKNVKRVARASTGAIDNILEKLSEYLQMPFNKEELLNCGINFNLLVYSMGNFMFQSYVEGSKYDGETRMFNNVVLCQADCDNEGHELWIEHIQAGKRVYITINEEDKILGWSDANFQKDRLGRTVRDLVAENTIYVDFTDGPDVGNTHQLWGKKTNDTVAEFFDVTLNGGRGEEVSGLHYDGLVNAFRMD